MELWVWYCGWLDRLVVLFEPELVSSLMSGCCAGRTFRDGSRHSSSTCFLAFVVFCRRWQMPVEMEMEMEMEMELVFPRFWCQIPGRGGSFATVKNFRQASRHLRLKKVIVSQLMV
jgi:hypothetical protein